MFLVEHFAGDWPVLPGFARWGRGLTGFLRVKKRPFCTTIGEKRLLLFMRLSSLGPGFVSAPCESTSAICPGCRNHSWIVRCLAGVIRRIWPSCPSPGPQKRGTGATRRGKVSRRFVLDAGITSGSIGVWQESSKRLASSCPSPVPKGEGPGPPAYHSTSSSALSHCLIHDPSLDRSSRKSRGVRSRLPQTLSATSTSCRAVTSPLDSRSSTSANHHMKCRQLRPIQG